jgi:hypothetical protein
MRYAALGAEVRTDATDIPQNIQYAADPSRYGIDPNALTDIPQIDDTTKKLLNILVDTSDRVGLFSGSPKVNLKRLRSAGRRNGPPR